MLTNLSFRCGLGLEASEPCLEFRRDLLLPKKIELLDKKYPKILGKF
jgi:hypothetical protein